MAFVLGVFVVLFAAAALALRPRTCAGQIAVDDLDIFALSARYRPMLRLLDGSDFDVLQGAGDPKLLRRVRAQRRAIFKSYLRSLRRDHARLCAQVRTVIIQSDEDRRDLASALFRMQISFNFLLTSVYLRLVLNGFGVGSVPAAGLMNSFERVRREAEFLSPTRAFSA